MWVELLLLALALVASWLWRVRSAQRHWQSIGLEVPCLSFPFGNHPFFMWKGTKKIHNADASREQYEVLRGKNVRFYGGYSFNQRFIVVTDPELAKDIMVRNFHCFTDRNAKNSEGFLVNTGTIEDEINLRQFVVMKGEAWKDQRSAFTPVFTTGKMKHHMFGLVREVCQKLMGSLDKEAERDTAFDLKNKFGKLSMDTIASCAFGVDARSFSEEEETEFVLNAKNVFRLSAVEMVKFMALALLPFVATFYTTMKITVAKQKEISFFHSVIKQTMDHRAKNKVRRNDFVDLMLDAMRGEAGKEENEEDREKDSDLTDQIESDGKLAHKVANRKYLDELTVVGSALNLMTAGYDTTSTALGYLCYYLALNPEVQERVQSEMDELREEEEDSGKDFPSYDGLAKLEYLDMAFHEVLRLHPPLAMIQRGCTADYKIPDSDIWVKKGDEIFINAIGMHYDPDIYPEPKKFNPENFSRESKEKRHPYTFLGFGQGPRNCIGMRFALLEAKLTMTSILSKYSLVKCSETPETLTLDPDSILSNCKEDLMVKLQLRK